MYLEGQLPYGPVTTNVGPAPIPTMDDPGTEQTFTVGDGTTVISPSVATANGIVQTPDTVTKVPTSGPLPANSARYNQCGDYAADGSLTSIRERRPNDPACGVGSSSAATPAGIGLFFAALAGLMLLTPKRGR